MNTAIELINTNTAKLSSKISKLNALKKQIEKENAKFNKVLSEHYVQSGEEINALALVETLGDKRTFDIILKVLEKRTLSSAELLQPFVLKTLERVDSKILLKIKNNLELSFNSLDKKSKIKFSFHCSGVYPMHIKYSFCATFLLNNYDIKENSTESYLTLYSFNPEPVNKMRMSVLIKEKDKVGAHNIATNIFNLINDGEYKNVVIDINNRRNATVEVNDSLVVINGHFIHRFTSKQPDILGQLKECMEYISVHIHCDDVDY